MTAPDHLTLGELIDRLKAEDPGKRIKVGFRNPHSYRGYYEQLAFEIARNVTVGEMLAAAESALGAVYQGWKGGDYDMDAYSHCWLVTEPGNSMGETIGAIFLDLMLANEAGDVNGDTS